MRKIIVLAAIAGLGALTPALADKVAQTEKQAPQGRAISSDEMRSKIDIMGYDVLRLHKDDGRYEAHITDRDSGGAVTAIFDAKNGELVHARPADKERRNGSDTNHRDGDDDKGEKQERHERE